MKTTFEERQTLIHSSVARGVFPRLSVNGRCVLLRVEARRRWQHGQPIEWFCLVYRVASPIDLEMYTKEGLRASFMLPHWSAVK